jgi:hypothetical protein
MSWSRLPASIVDLSDYQGRVEVFSILGCVVLLFSLLELLRRRRLKERYSVLWFVTSFVLLVFTLRRQWLEDLSTLLGVYYPPTALFLILVFFMLIILIHFSTVISELLNDKQILTQSLAILETRVRELEEKQTRKSKPK